MGNEGIRYAAKVSLDKDAAEQECLHVQTRLPGPTRQGANMSRTDGIQIIPRTAQSSKTKW